MAACGFSIYLCCLAALLTVSLVTEYADGADFWKSLYDHTSASVDIGESSGHGALQFPGSQDADLTDDGGDYGMPETDAKGGLDWPPYGADKPSLTLPGLPTITCFRCHGDNNKGCDILDMLNDMDFYSMKCLGKCMNVSSGKLAVYDCAHDMIRNENTCIHNQDTEICFCAQNYCNGPGDVKRFLASDRQVLPPFAYGARSNGTTGARSTTEGYSSEDYDDELNSYDEQFAGNETESSSHRTTSGKKWQLVPHTGNTDGGTYFDLIDPKGKVYSKHIKEQGRKTTQEEDPFSDYDYVPRKNINHIIPKQSRSRSSVSTDTEMEYMTSENPVNINRPVVGKLKDSSVKTDNMANFTMFSLLTILLCQVVLKI
nr:hypothetical protein BgiMline_013880 [Biomphalaria glabrata]